MLPIGLASSLIMPTIAPDARESGLAMAAQGFATPLSSCAESLGTRVHIPEQAWSRWPGNGQQIDALDPYRTFCKADHSSKPAVRSFSAKPL
jgi:hypothetical protein